MIASFAQHINPPLQKPLISFCVFISGTLIPDDSPEEFT